MRIILNKPAEHYQRCFFCRTDYLQKDMKKIGHTYYICRECIKKYYTQCFECGNIILDSDNAFQCNECGEYFCDADFDMDRDMCWYCSERQ